MTLHVLVGIPTGRSGWNPDFCMSFLGVMLRPMAHDLGLIDEPVINYQYVRGSMLPQNRHTLVRAAQELNATHLLWLDDDMIFPADTLLRLLKADEMIVGANCTTRAYPIIPTAIKDDQRIMSRDKKGLESIDQFGLAVVLVNMEVYKKIPPPWFKMEWDAQYPDTYMSEDMYFCRKARQAGYRIYVDHDLSNQIGHVGEITYDHSVVDEDELAEVNAKTARTAHIKVA